MYKYSRMTSAVNPQVLTSQAGAWWWYQDFTGDWWEQTETLLQDAASVSDTDK